jgi:hypothetical protein
MNTCVVCFGTVTATPSGDLQLVGEPFLPSLPHRHETAGSLDRVPLAA